MKTAIKNLFYCFNKYQYYNKNIFSRVLWRCMFGIPSLQLDSPKNVGKIEKTQMNFLIKTA